ncbi:MAG: DNA-binding protein [Oscillatoriales cyanobacterium]|jgi:antitoxin FitA|nr:MAG: DNA-binding protein [Oscillatoriales cyanobacterium]
MVTVSLQVSETQWERLRSLAAEYELSPEQLLALSLDDWMADREAEFEVIADRVLTKNAELYERLS